MKRLLETIKSHVIVMPLCCFALCGFTKIIDWGKENFKQAEYHGDQFAQSAQPYIKNIKFYNQFTVEATFDIMLLTDQMRMLYVDYYIRDHGMTRDAETMMRQRQYNENRYFISMYVIGYQKEHAYLNNRALFTGEYQKATEMLKGNDAMWNLRLVVGGKQFLPESVRVVELPVEYRAMFGVACNQYATVYLVRFPAYDAQQNYVIPVDKPSTVTLYLSSARFHGHVVWQNMNYYFKQ